MTPEVKLEKYGPGPWMDEPDYLEFSHNGMDCRIMRNMLGSLCGYVKLPENHPWEKEDIFHSEAEVHGGITYSNKEDDGFWIGFDCAHLDDFCPSIEHNYLRMEKLSKMKDLPEPLKEILKNYPKMTNVLKKLNTSTYRNIAYVQQECRSLANQVIASYTQL